jgi:hypothetical protein
MIIPRHASQKHRIRHGESAWKYRLATVNRKNRPILKSALAATF